jgi:acyl dehydratase
VHIRNTFDKFKPMPDDAAYDVRAALTAGRATHQGIEFDILTEYTDESGEVVHRSLMTPLYRMKTGKPAPPRSKAVVPSQLAEYRSFDVPEDQGRKYAPIGGDFNPIHLHRLGARAFGFPRAIAHGMWSVAYSAGLLEAARGAPSTHLEVQFRQPLLLPGKVSLKFSGSGEQTEFALLSRTSDKVHFTGLIL